MTGVSVIEPVEEVGLGELGPTGWIPPENIGFTEWERAMRGFIEAQNSLNWVIGDGLNFGEQKWGEMYAQAILVTDWAYQRLADAKWVAASVPRENRSGVLTWTHHRYVAKLPPGAQREWLEQAEQEEWSTSDLRGRMNGKSIPSGPATQPMLVVENKPRTAARLLVELATIWAANENTEEWRRNFTRHEEDVIWPETKEMLETLCKWAGWR